jgi:hypothetical protein
MFTFLGWVAWNWFELSLTKDESDQRDEVFDLKKYTYKKWDNWVLTFIVATILFFVGHAGLGLALVKTFDEKMEWSDLYYLGSGFITELIIFSYRRWVKREKS